ncbi:MAG TPA: DUF459 domain-containing protein [Spirochaetota bacterium]|nr:DUF459 domain-containing protein [Spirochaetota bacterium]HOD15615.1 DUF459 domain-containing protein [Spirochaetota bacterium]HPG49979.1 DUF459 domain-containing protein [Spirochaetota bacterium]HQL83663.1 DUF459 domain-containing protein [Spirochaetota bacterium]
MTRRFQAAALVIAAITLAGCVSYTRVRLDPPIRFLLVGDSLMQGYFGFMLEKRLRETPGVRAARIAVKSTGLSEFIRYDWHGRTLLYIRQYRPDVLVLLFGGNDCYALRRENGTLIMFTSDEWRNEYAARLDGYLDAIAPLVKRVYLVGPPSTDHPYFRERYPVLNDLFRERCRKHRGVRYVPAWEMTSERGTFVAVMKDSRGIAGRVKYPDDPIHHTPFGGQVLAERFLDYISDEFRAASAR